MKSLLQELRDNEYTMIHSEMGNEYSVESYKTNSGREFQLLFNFTEASKAAYMGGKSPKRVSNFYRWRIERAMRKGAEKE